VSAGIRGAKERIDGTRRTGRNGEERGHTGRAKEKGTGWKGRKKGRKERDELEGGKDGGPRAMGRGGWV
jgi:hypothetical protein